MGVHVLSCRFPQRTPTGTWNTLCAPRLAPFSAIAPLFGGVRGSAPGRLPYPHADMYGSDHLLRLRTLSGQQQHWRARGARHEYPLSYPPSSPNLASVCHGKFLWRLEHRPETREESVHTRRPIREDVRNHHRICGQQLLMCSRLL